MHVLYVDDVPEVIWEEFSCRTLLPAEVGLNHEPVIVYSIVDQTL